MGGKKCVEETTSKGEDSGEGWDAAEEKRTRVFDAVKQTKPSGQ